MFGMMKASMKLPLHVKAWMGLMMLVFLAHIPFYASPLHLISLLGFFLTAMVLGNISFAMSKNINALAVAHFVVWPAILVNGVNQLRLPGALELSSTAGLVLIVGYGIFFISLLMDFRILMNELQKTGPSPTA